MYRLAAFLIAVAVLVGMVFAGDFQHADPQSFNSPHNEIAQDTHSDRMLHEKADQELADIERKSETNTFAIGEFLADAKPALTTDDINSTVKNAGNNASETAIRVGQSAEQAMKALHSAEQFVRSRLENHLRHNKSAADLL